MGLKNGGATCYMNAVLQQLYMIPHIRANLLSLPCPEEGREQEGQGDMSPAKLHHLGVAKQVSSYHQLFLFCTIRFMFLFNGLNFKSSDVFPDFKDILGFSVSMPPN